MNRSVVELNVTCLLSLDGYKFKTIKNVLKKGQYMEGKVGGKSVLQKVLSLLPCKSADHECENL